MTTEDEEIIQEFLVESHENLDQLDRDLVDLEQEPSSRPLLSSIFRTIHTIKGTSGFLALGRLEALTHIGENLLSRLRDGELTLTPPTVEALLRMVDCVRALLAAVEDGGSDSDESVDVDQVVAELTACLVPAASGAHSPPPAAKQVATAAVAAAQVIPAPVIDWVVDPVVDPAVDLVRVDVPVQDRRGSDRRVADSTVRVDVDLLDTLMRLVGELVLTRNQIVQQAGQGADVELVQASHRLNLVASELQENVMKTRMRPIGQVWATMPRVVRDLSVQLGRKVRLEMEGQDTELDRSLLEAVKDPLTHLVRNSLDHGIEAPDERVSKGKPAEGTLILRACHERGQVLVEVSDDGKGIDPGQVGRIAVERGVISADQLARMDAREMLDIIFRPGFSTVDAVTNVSGRGVGMDVVRTNIERIGGTVDLASHAGQGTTVRVHIPLTLAIIPALIVGEGGERYAIPQSNLVELVRLDPADQSRGIETLAGARVLRLRGHLLPIVSLSGALGLEGEPPESLTIIVVQADEMRFGLAVAEVHDTQEIVVKPLGRQLRGLQMYVGATIMGDGRVALILDVGGLGVRSGVGASTTNAGDELRMAGPDLTALLILDVGSNSRVAVPLAAVSRLEEFPRERIELSGSTEVVQYRDGVLPLIRLGRAIGVSARDEGEPVSVVVHGEGKNSVGLIVEQVIDVVETVVTVDGVGVRHGVLGSAIVGDRITDLVDIDAIVAAAGVRS